MATQPFTFFGQGFSLQGDKGRFVLPAKMRKPVKDASEGDKIICLDKHETLPCLTAFGLSRRDFIAQQLMSEQEQASQRGERFDFDTRAQQLGGFFEVPFDDSGRFVIPRHLLDLAKIDGAAYFHGAVRFYMIWSPDQLAKMGPEWDAAKASCASAMAAARERKA